MCAAILLIALQYKCFWGAMLRLAAVHVYEPLFPEDDLFPLCWHKLLPNVRVPTGSLRVRLLADVSILYVIDSEAKVIVRVVLLPPFMAL